jgi:hypothetical protein
MNYFKSSMYSAALASGEKVNIDVTNSISAGLDPNAGLVTHLSKWMKERELETILDFGAGALRHAVPLLRAGFNVIAVEYEIAYSRPRAAEARKTAQRFSGFTQLVWPADFVRSKLKYDVAILAFVLQVVPVKVERKVIIDEIAKRFDPSGPRRLYYASRYGDGPKLPEENRYNDGWIKGRGQHDRTFYTEWSGPDTHAFFKKSKFEKVASYGGASQPYIYDYKPGAL